MTDPLLQEVHETVGMVPLVLRAMHEDGDLGANWPLIRSMFASAPIVGPELFFAMVTALSLRCADAYCFVMYGVRLEKVEAPKIGQWFDFPASIPNHGHWSRVLKLAWLVLVSGPHQGVARHALRASCNDEEFKAITAIIQATRLLTRYAATNPRVNLDDEPAMRQLPEAVASLIPKFVQFHTHYNDSSRPVAAMCSICRQVRAKDEAWYPFDAAHDLLPRDVIHSHGLCPPCESEMLAQYHLG